MNTKVPTCLFLISVFLLSHAAGVVKAEQPNGLDISLVAIQLNESCDENVNGPPSVVLNTEQWTTLCLKLTGTPEDSGLLEFEGALVANDEAYSMFQHEVYLVDGSDLEQYLAFDVFIPGAWYNQSSFINVEWTLTSRSGAQTEADIFTLDTTLLATPVAAMVNVPQEQITVPAGADLTILAEVTSLTNQTGYFDLHTRVVDLGLEASSVHLTLAPYSTQTEGLVVHTATLSEGVYSLEILAKQNSTTDVITSTYPFEVIEPQSQTAVQDVDWNRSVFDQALHPGMNLTLTVSTSNTGSLDGHLSVELNCNNGAFVDTKQVIVPPGFSGEMNIVYELYTALSFGELLCEAQPLRANEYPLPKLLMTPWPSEFSFLPRDMVLNDFSYITLDADGNLDFDYLITNLGQGTEEVRIHLSAVSESHEVQLSSFVHTFGPNEALEGTINSVLNTCFAGVWDLVATVEYMDQRESIASRVESILETKPATFKSSFIDVSFSETQVQSGAGVDADIYLEVYDSSRLDCTHAVPVQIVAKEETTSTTYTWHRTMEVGSSNLAVERLSVDTSALGSGTYEFFAMILTKQPVLSGVEVMDTSVYTPIEIVQPDSVVQVACDDLGEVRALSPQTSVRCTLENVFSTTVVTKIQAWNSEGKVRQKIITVPPQDSEDFEMTSTHETFGQHWWMANVSVLTDGKYVLQEPVLKVDYELIHPGDEGTKILDFSISPDVPLRGAPVAIDVKVQGGSDALHPYLKVHFGSEEAQSTLYKIDDVRIGKTNLVSLSGIWPNDCQQHEVTVQLFRDEGTTVPIGDPVARTAQSCPKNLPDLDFSNITFNENGSVEVSVMNTGSQSSRATTVRVWYDGMQTEAFELPPLAPLEMHALFAPNPGKAGAITVELDPDNRVSEFYDGLQNIRTVANSAMDWQASAVETVLDSDGDGLSDEVELNGWEVFVVENKDHVESLQAYFNGEAEDVSITAFPNITSNHLSIDSDGDGLTDYAEFMYRTNPLSSDTDGDGLSDLHELESPTEDPVMVETNPPEITAMSQLLDTSTNARAPGDKHLSSVFYIDEPHLESVQVHYNDSGGNLKILQPEFIGFEDGLRKYTVAYTLNIYKNIISDVEIHVEAIDTYGETTWAMIANHDSLGKRMTTKLAQYAYDSLGPLGQNMTAFGAGATYSLFSLVKEMVDGVMGVLQFIWLLLTNAKQAWQDVVKLIGELKSLFSLEVLKQLPGLLYEQALSLSPFKDATSNNLFVSGFVLGYIVLTAALFIVGGAGFAKAKSMMKGGKGSDAVSFTDEIKKGVAKKVESIKNIKQLPQKFKSGFAKIMAGTGNALAPLLAAGTMSQYKSISVVFKAMTKWFVKGDKVDADTAQRLKRAIKVAEHPRITNLQSKWVKLPFIGQAGKTMSAMRKAVNDPDLFKGLESLNCKACYDKEFDEFIGAFVREDGSLRTGKDAFRKVQTPYLDELHHIGRKTVDDNTVVIIKPGQCNPKLCPKRPDIDNLKITFDKDGSVKDIEIIDRKVYEDQNQLKSTFKKSTIKRGGKTSDYHKQNFKEYFDGPEGKERFKEYLKDTGLSDDEIDKVYDEMKKFADGDSSRVTSRYSAKMMDEQGGPTSTPVYANCWKPTSPVNCDDHRDSEKEKLRKRKCNHDECIPKPRDYTEQELDDLVDEMLNTEYIDLPIGISQPLSPLQRWVQQSNPLLVPYADVEDATVEERSATTALDDFTTAVLMLLIGSVLAVIVLGRRKNFNA